MVNVSSRVLKSGWENTVRTVFLWKLTDLPSKLSNLLTRFVNLEVITFLFLNLCFIFSSIKWGY